MNKMQKDLSVAKWFCSNFHCWSLLQLRMGWTGPIKVGPWTNKLRPDLAHVFFSKTGSAHRTHGPIIYSKTFSKNSLAWLAMPSPSVQAGFGRKTLEIAGTWKQYSGWNVSEFFLWRPPSFLLFSCGKTAGSQRENPEASFSEYCFHVPEIFGGFMRVPVWIQHEFSGKFEVPTGSGGIWDRQSSTWVFV
jgi:hypothetical protein